MSKETINDAEIDRLAGEIASVLFSVGYPREVDVLVMEVNGVSVGGLCLSVVRGIIAERLRRAGVTSEQRVIEAAKKWKVAMNSPAGEVAEAQGFVDAQLELSAAVEQLEAADAAKGS